MVTPTGKRQNGSKCSMWLERRASSCTHKHEHRKLVDQLLGIDVAQRDNEAFATWIEAKAHVDFLIGNAVADEFVAHANGPFAFIHCALVPLDRLSPLNTDDLLGWSFSSSGYRSCYLSGGVGNDVWVEHGFCDHGSKTLKSGQNLIFRRTFEGWSGEDRSYFELLQEFSHLADIHWRPERCAYCKIDEEGNVAPIVSVTQRAEGLDRISLVSVARNELDEFLAASQLGIVRMFDFTLLRRGQFSDYGDDPEEVHSRGSDLHYRPLSAVQPQTCV